MPKEHILLIRYPTHHLSLNHYKKKFPTYEYIISLKYEAKQIQIGRPDKLTNQEDPDITYTYGQAGCSVHDFIIKKNIGRESSVRGAGQLHGSRAAIPFDPES